METIEKLFDNIFFIYLTAFLSILIINKGASDIYEVVAIGFWALLALPLVVILLFVIEIILSVFLYIYNVFSKFF